MLQNGHTQKNELKWDKIHYFSLKSHREPRVAHPWPNGIKQNKTQKSRNLPISFQAVLNVINNRLSRNFFTMLKLVAGKAFLWNLFKSLVSKGATQRRVSLDSWQHFHKAFSCLLTDWRTRRGTARGARWDNLSTSELLTIATQHYWWLDVLPHHHMELCCQTEEQKTIWCQLFSKALKF